MLSQPHSAVNHMNYSILGSHTVQDAANNAKNNFSPSQRSRHARTAYQNNHQNLMQPAIANNPHLADVLRGSQDPMGASWNTGAFLIAAGVGGLLSVVSSKDMNIFGKSKKIERKFFTIGTMIAACGLLAVGYSKNSELIPAGIGLLSGNVVGNNLWSIGSRDSGFDFTPSKSLFELDY